MATDKLTNSYNAFLNISGINKLIDTFNPDPKRNIIKQAQNLLVSDNFESYFNLVQQGYIPTAKQQGIVDNFIAKIFNRQCDYRMAEPTEQQKYVDLEKYLANGLQLNNQNVIDFLCARSHASEYSGLLENEEFFTNRNYVFKATAGRTNVASGMYKSTSVDLPYLTQQLRQVMNNEDFPEFLLKDFKTFLKTIHYKNGSNHKLNSYRLAIPRYQYLIKHIPQLLFKHMPIEEFMKVSKKFKDNDIYDTEMALINEACNKVYVQQLSQVVAETKNNYSNNLVKSLTLENMKIQLTTEKDIPTSALKVIQSVEDFYNKIKTHKDLKSHVAELEQLDILLEKRIPEVLSKFLTIDPSYRTSLVSSQGKNAEQLMLESLDNIKESFTQVFENLNQNSVDSLSATNRYTKSLKI